MVSTLTVGLNSYATLAEANSFLGDQLRAASKWEGTDDDTKTMALISAFRIFEKQTWNGDKTEVDVVATAAVGAGGTGYVLNELLTISGGTFGAPAIVRASGVTAGVVTAVTLVDVGTYTAGSTPSSPAATTGGSGTGCTIALTFQDQVASHPRTGLVDNDGAALDDDTYADGLRYGQIELAFELTQNAALETSGGVGSNVKGVGAGSARVDFFRPTGGAEGEGSNRFPTTVWEWIRSLLSAGNATVSGGFVSGAEAESTFIDHPGNYGFSNGV